ncbi:hypothetical protein, partial [Adlercreutzia muris]|uniref:hypothetical protein n=1 Tax=Adlercreutzia muris TaxID=1796610 RepID=UPI00214B5595
LRCPTCENISLGRCFADGIDEQWGKTVAKPLLIWHFAWNFRNMPPCFPLLGHRLYFSVDDFFH